MSALGEIQRNCRAFFDRLRSEVRVLVVDDEPIVTDLLRDVLSDRGYRVDAVASAEDAWDPVLSAPYDLLIVDKNLPGASGVEFLFELRAAGIDAPAVLITGYGTIASVSEALACGVADYLTKPFHDVSAVQRRLARVIEEHDLSLLYSLAAHELKTAIDRKELEGPVLENIARHLVFASANVGRRRAILALGDRAGSPAVLEALRAADLDAVAQPDAPRRSEDMPLVVLTDIGRPDALDQIQALRDVDPFVEILTIANEPVEFDVVVRALEAGAGDFTAVFEEGAEALPPRALRAVRRGRKRRLGLQIVATLYEAARDANAGDWEDLLAMLPPLDRRLVEELAGQGDDDPEAALDLAGLDAVLEEAVKRVDHLQDEPTVANTRRHERWRWGVRVWIVLHDPAHVEPTILEERLCRDISQGGMFLEGAPPAIGTLVVIHLPDDESGILPVTARVLRHAGPKEQAGFAVEFVATDELVQRALARFE